MFFNNERYNIRHDEESGIVTLLVKNVSSHDEGCYTCRAENSEGVATTTAFLVVRGNDGYTPLTYERSTEEETSQIQVTKTDKAAVIEEYITRVEEFEEESIEEKKEAPKITYPEELLEELKRTKQGSLVYIEAQVTGYPRPKINWFFKDQKLTTSSNIFLQYDDNYAFLKLSNVQGVHSGIYKLLAENSHGRDTAEFSVKIRTVPSSPRNLQAIEVSRDYVVLQWEEPENDGDEKITGYHIDKLLTASPTKTWVNAGYVDSSVKKYKASRLFEYSEYLFRVACENRIGLSEFIELAESITVKLPFDAPGPPQNLEFEEINKDFVILKWDQPECDGGSEITQYIVEKSEVIRYSNSWNIVETLKPTERRLKVDKLFLGNSYNFRITAENRVGPSKPLQTKEPITTKLPFDKPSPPLNLRPIEINRDSVYLEWDKPESDGGNEITNYVIEKRDAKRPGWIFIVDLPARESKYKATRLFEGNEYFFRIYAENEAGTSEPFEMEKPILARLPYDEPNAPKNLKVKETWSDYVVLEWDNPDFDGGSPITNFIIEKKENSLPTWMKCGRVNSATHEFKVDNLFQRTSYFFRIFAENEVGLSKTSAEIFEPIQPRLPFNVPQAPSNFHVVSYNVDKIKIEWEKPEDDGGSPIERFVIEKREISRPIWLQSGAVPANVTTFTLDNLFEGESYLFRIAAENKAGRSVYLENEDPVTAKLPFDKPASPQNFTKTKIWKDYIELQWESPSEDGGSKVTGYILEMKDGLEVSFKRLCKLDANINSFVVKNLKENREYDFRLFAVNDAGASTRPAQIDGIRTKLPFDKPSKPASISANELGPGKISVNWEKSEKDGGSEILGYVIEVCEFANLEYRKVKTTSADENNVEIDTLQPNERYFVRVSAKNEAGVGEYCELEKPVCARRPPTAPSAVRNLQVQRADEKRISLAWDEPETDGGNHILGYILEISEDGGEFTVAADVPAFKNFYDFENLQVNTGYKFRISAKNPQGQGPVIELNEPSYLVKPISRPSTPTNFTAVPTVKEVVLSWDVISNDSNRPDTFVIELSRNNGRWEYVDEIPSDQAKFNVSNLRSQYDLQFRIYAQNKAGKSKPIQLAESVRLLEELTSDILDAPKSVSVKNVTESALTLEWIEPDESKNLQYIVEGRKTTETEFQLVKKTDKPSAIIENLSPNEKYIFQVKSVNETSSSENAAVLDEPVCTKAIVKDTEEVKEVATVTEPPLNLRLKETKSNEITVEWDKPESLDKVESFIVQYKKEGKKKWKEGVVVDLQDSLVHLTNLDEDKVYEISVAAKLSSGDLISSDTIKAKTIVSEKSPNDKLPKLENLPDDIKIKAGDDLLLSCKSTGTPGPEISFYKNDKKIKTKKSDKRIKVDWDMDADKYTLTIKEANPDDSGEYKVVAENEHGKQEKLIKISIDEEKQLANESELKEKPKPMEELKVKEANSKSISIEWQKPENFDNLEAIVVEYREQGKKEWKEAAVISSNETGYTLDKLKENKPYEIAIVSKGSDGQLSSPQIVEVNTTPVAEEKPEVKGKVPEVAELPDEIHQHPGDVIEISCRVSGEPEPEVQFLKNGKTIKPKKDKRIKIDWDMKTNVYKLKISDCTCKDSGEYKITAENNLGTLEKTVKVSIEEKPKEKEPSSKEEEPKSSLEENIPKIKDVQDNFSLKTGETMKISCHLEGEPEPEIKFVKDGKTIKVKKNERMKLDWDMENNIHTLSIKEVSTEDSGTYLIKAENKFGKAEKEVKVQIIEEKKNTEEDKLKKAEEIEKRKPKIVNLPEKINLETGKPIEISFKSQGDPEPEIKFMKDSKQLKPKKDSRIKIDWNMDNGQYSLIIKDAILSDSGDYVILSENEFGKIEKSIKVDIEEPKKLEKEVNEIKEEVVAENVEELKETPDHSAKSLEEASVEPEKVATEKAPDVIKDEEKYKKKQPKSESSKSEESSEESSSEEETSSESETESSSEESSSEEETSSEEESASKSESSVAEKPSTKLKEGTVEAEKKPEAEKDKDKKIEEIQPTPVEETATISKSENEDLQSQPKSEEVKVKEPEKVEKQEKIEEASMEKPEIVEKQEKIIEEPEIVEKQEKIKEEPEKVEKQENKEQKPSETEKVEDMKSESTESSTGSETSSEETSSEESDSSEESTETESEKSEKVSASEKKKESSPKPKPMPEIKIKLLNKDNNLSVEEGEELILSCAIVGGNEVKVVWMKDGKKLAGNSRILLDSKNDEYSLKIPKINKEDAGEYQLVVSSEDQKLEQPFSVKITEKPVVQDSSETSSEAASSSEKTSEESDESEENKPEFVLLPEDVTASPGETIKLKCKVNASADIDVKWLKSNVVINTKKMAFKNTKQSWEVETDEYTLLICDCKPSDSGQYSIQATTDDDSIVHNFSVNVVEIVENPRKPRPEISWTKSGKDVKSKKRFKLSETEGGVVLKIKNAHVEDSGEYTIVATNKGGKVTSNFQLSVEKKKEKEVKPEKKAPEILEKPEESITIQEQESVSIAAKIEGLNECEISILKDGNEIQKDNIQVLVQDNTVSLKFDEVKVIDSGEYAIKATNSQGSCLCSAKIAVIQSQSEEKKEQEISEVAEEIVPEVEISNEAEIVKKAPEIVDKPEEHLKVNQFQDACIKARIQGLEESNLTVQKDGKDVPKDRLEIRVEEDMITVQFNQVELIDSGEYSIKATNTEGSCLCSTKIEVIESKVQEKQVEESSCTESTVETLSEDTASEKLKETLEAPKILEQLEDSLNINEFESLSFSTKIQGLEESVVSVLKDGKEIKTGDKVQIHVKDDFVSVRFEEIQAEDGGIYSIRASNNAGTCQSAVTVNVIECSESDDEDSSKQRDSQEALEVPSTEKETSEEIFSDDGKEAKKYFKALTDYNPTDTDGLALVEGQEVEVLDSNNPEKWLCKDSLKTGWVPPSYLVQPKEEKLDTRSPREVFRDDVIQIKDKDQEAMVKRRYALTELIESERDYIRELERVLDGYYNLLKSDEVPECLKDKQNFAFGPLPEIFKFHKDEFLESLYQTTTEGDSIGQAFIDHALQFSRYIPYLVDRKSVKDLLALEDAENFLKEVQSQDSKKPNLVNGLQLPFNRLDDYVKVLRDLIKYNTRAGQTVTKLDDAVKMLLDLKIQAEKFNLLNSIKNYDNLKDLCLFDRYDTLTVWSDTPKPSAKGKERKVFLFEDRLLITKMRKDENDLPIFDFQSEIMIEDIWLDEHLDEPTRFALPFVNNKKGRWTFEAKNEFIKKAWCDDIKKLLCKRGLLEDGTSKPKLLSNLQSVNVEMGKEVNFVIKASSIPYPTCIWFLNDKPLKSSKHCKINSSSDNFELHLLRTVPEMSGSLKVRLENKNGSIEDECKVVIRPEGVFEDGTTLPKIESKLKKVEIFESESAEFTIKTSGLPEVDVEWSLNDKLIKDSDLEHEINKDSLKILNTNKSIEGTIKVTVSNKNGKIEDSCELIVKEVVLNCDFSNLKNFEVKSGEDIKFGVKVSSKPKPIIRLLKDGKEITKNEKYSIKYEKETITVKVKKVSTEEIGTYEIFVKCLNKEKTGTFGLELVKEIVEDKIDEKTVEPEQSIQNQLENGIKKTKEEKDEKEKKKQDNDEENAENKKDIEVEEGKKKKLKDDEDGKKSKGRRGSKDSDNSSKAKKKKDEAKTKDKTEKKKGKDDTDERKTKNRRESKDSITSEESSKKKKKENGEVKRSKKSPDAEAEKDKEKKRKSSKDSIISDDSDKKKKSKKDEVDGDEKKVKSDKKKKKSVEPIFPPLIDTHLKDLKTTEDFQIKLSCKYTADEPAKTTWMKDGQEIIKSDRYHYKNRLGSASLIIEKTVLEDTGTYTLVLENEGGSSESNCKVRIEEDEIKRSTKPIFETALQDAEIRRGYTYMFNAVVSGTPKPEVEWFYNSRPIYETERIRTEAVENRCSLIISKCMKMDAGDYSCKISNAAGQSRTSAYLSIIDDEEKIVEDNNDMGYKPTLSKKLSTQDIIVGMTAKFECKALGEPKPTAIWKKDGVVIEETLRIRTVRVNNSYQLIIEDAEVDDYGEYEVILENSFGSISSTAKLFVEAPKKLKKPKKHAIFQLPPTMPLVKPDMTDVKEKSFKMSWPEATYGPNVAVSEVTYAVERRELPSGDWTEAKKDIKETYLLIDDYEIDRDYMYRVKAQNTAGFSEPTLSLTYFAKIVEKPKEKVDFDKHKAKLPPRAPWNAPQVSDVTADSLKLEWDEATVPSQAVTTEILYTIERRCPPSKNWIELVTDLKEATYTFKGYKPEKDYLFRVKAFNKYGTSDPSMSTQVFAKPPEAEKKEQKKLEETIKSKVKPRTIWEKPTISDVTDNSLALKWKASSLPAYAMQVPIWYIVEKRVPPGKDWIEVVSDTKETTYNITKVDRNKDVYYRVKAANQFGISEPSMPAMLKRKEVKDEEQIEKPKKSKQDKENEARTKKIPEHLRIAPEFIGQMDDTQYGVETKIMKIRTAIKAYPDPKIIWYFNKEKLYMGEKYCSSLAASGELILEINNFSWSDVGEYKIHVENEVGSANQDIKVDMADPPTFLEPMKDQIFNLRSTGKLECRVFGIPYPDVEFKKDWRVIADSHRVKIRREEYDHWTLSVDNAIRLDEGVYECVLSNVAGKVYCTANVKVSVKANYIRDLKFNPCHIEDYFHVIDEIGRGSYGVVRRVIEKNSGYQYAAKFLRYSDPALREELTTELEVMTYLDHHNIAQLQDGYDDKKRLVIVTEILTGGELLPKIVKDDSFTESEAAHYLKQLLLAVEHIHSKNIVHLDLKPENLLLTNSSSEEIKLIDFGFARKLNPRLPLHAKYCTPEFAAPEVADNQPISTSADMWNVGIIAYILLSGSSPFANESDRDALLNVAKADWNFNDSFSTVSGEAKDFISRLLVKDPRKRITASQAIDHPFIDLSNRRGLGDKINLERHKSYIFRRKCQRGLRSIKTMVEPRSINDIINGPMTVPALQLPEISEPDGFFSPPRTRASSVFSCATDFQEAGAAGMLEIMGPPSMITSAAPSTIGSGSSSDWEKEYEDEDTWYEWSAAYQSGPEAQLLPAEDVKFNVRMARYRRASSKTSVRSRSRRERQDLRDLEREAEDNAVVERKPKKTSLWHLKNSADTQEALPPIFKTKINDKAYNVGEPCTVSVYVIGNPSPTVSWYRNDEILTQGGRVRTWDDGKGRHTLTILQTKPNDFGVFKCIARNKYGKVTCRARMLLGDHPSRPGRPHVTSISDIEAFLIWEEPEQDGNSYILSYRIDYIKLGDKRWTTATYSIDECALVKGLRRDTTYRFRVSALNKFGISPYSWASIEVKTKAKGAPSINIDSTTKKILLRSRQATCQPSPEATPTPSRETSVEREKVKSVEGEGFVEQEVFLQEKVDPEKYLKFGSEVWRGRYSLIRDCSNKTGSQNDKRVVKIVSYDEWKHEDCLREYEMLKAVRQEHIVRLFEAYLYKDFLFLVLEKLSGENIARTLSLRNKYTEYHVTSVMKQVLDALQFLHHRGIVHLNLQPDNVITVSPRRYDIKLIDFGRSRKITSYEGIKVMREGTAEFMAPEKVINDYVGVPADIWGAGVLAFVLLSGVSPFRGEDERETFSNIKHVRYNAHEIYHNVTKYGLKFIYQIFKRKPKNRITTEECLEHRWLQLSPQLIQQRRSTIFTTDRLRNFEESYISRRMTGSKTSDELIKLYGKSAGAFDDFEFDE
ncbi:DgyrCDS9913 [Dimorphilus gyrociliatus]|uniref:DgyrCDS9913 n=1 Tax=Dimorphilus gyrociliatus TaxID=2664684 RepID=A0A7I8W022_9ANNE|nr:DgyrCDS9913 [Dimorphilus gyrociliatus]